jgi:hypothetical protein
LLSLFRRDRKKVSVYVLAAAISLPLGYFVISWSMNTYSFLSLYRPEQLFQENDDPAATHETKGTEILQALNAEIEQESHVKQTEEGWLLARVDRLWHSIRRYVSPSPEKKSRVAEGPRATLANEKPLSHPFPARANPTEAPGSEKTAQDLHNVLSLAADPEILETASEDSTVRSAPSRKSYKPLLTVSTKKAKALQKEEGDATKEWLYRFEPLKGVRTQSLIYQFNGNLALEGTVEATPMGETDTNLADFGFRTVHALNFLHDRPTPSIMMGYEGIHSGYPLSYGVGLNYQVSPLVNLRFDYSFETPNDYLVQYNGSWESSLMTTNYDKSRSDNPLSIHSFFLGFRYLVQQKATRIPLHTGFFYSTNMEHEPLSSNVSMGFSVGGGIHRRDLRLGFDWRFRIWDNPEQQFLDEQEMRELETRVSNQFLLTLMF